MNKTDVILLAGRMLEESGYVEHPYIDGMLRREEVFDTNIGNGIAIPHGTDDSKQFIRHSGIVVILFPQGTWWNQAVVKIVIGIAGKGDEHLDILANIAERLSDPQAVEELLNYNIDQVHQVFTGGI